MTPPILGKKLSPLPFFCLYFYYSPIIITVRIHHVLCAHPPLHACLSNVAREINSEVNSECSCMLFYTLPSIELMGPVEQLISQSRL